MDVGILSLGNLGTSIGNLVAENGYQALGWEYDNTVVEEVNGSHCNTKFLQGITLDNRLAATSDITDVLLSCEVVFNALPSMFIKSILEPVSDILPREVLLANLAKGIESESKLTSFQLITKLFPDNRKVVISGPSIANEFARNMPTAVVAAAEHEEDAKLVADILSNDYFRVSCSNDTIGVELGGILKNIYAVGLGVFDGGSIDGVNFKSLYLTLALDELMRFGVAMGGRRETYLHLCGMGDLIATSLSGQSHNRKLGELLGQGRSLTSIEDVIGIFPEGYNTINSIIYHALQKKVTMPLLFGLKALIDRETTTDDYLSAVLNATNNLA